MSDLLTYSIEDEARAKALEIADWIASLPDADTKILALNTIRSALHEVSPMRDEPVDLVLWVPTDEVRANDYNPNVVAPPEMRLLEQSILADGYTQPIVTHRAGSGPREVVDGFHRSRVGRESKPVKARVRGHLPVVQIRATQTDATDRMAATIRHNRARGKHGVEPMTGIVTYLAKKGWDDAKIGKEIGMEPDEVLRLKQITGLRELFADREFGEAWSTD